MHAFCMYVRHVSRVFSFSLRGRWKTSSATARTHASALLPSFQKRMPVIDSCAPLNSAVFNPSFFARISWGVRCSVCRCDVAKEERPPGCLKSFFFPLIFYTFFPSGSVRTTRFLDVFFSWSSPRRKECLLCRAPTNYGSKRGANIHHHSLLLCSVLQQQTTPTMHNQQKITPTPSPPRGQ